MHLLSKGTDVLPFAVKKDYLGQEPIYFALYEPSEDFTILCREYTTSENVLDSKQVAYILDTNKKKESINRPCLIICEVSSIDEADIVVESYRKALASLPKL